MSEDELLVSRSKHTGTICLNRPKALNSLTLNMVRAFTRALDEFGLDPEIHAVVVTGNGERGLCAGGDIRILYEARDGDKDHPKTFWREEYELNSKIASFPKYYLAVMDGIVMGGGVGISAHGNRRIVTERTRLAMPETGIGFIPDIGGTWLLTRNGGAGLYMALAGATVGAADAIHVGLADVLSDSARIPDLLNRLANIDAREEIDTLLSSFARAPGAGVLESEKELLDDVMRQESVEEIVAALVEDGSDFALRAADDISKRSPTSLKLTHELLKKAMAADSLEACLVNEYRAACSLLETHDLYEGIRAAIIDKDHDPRWFPATVEHVPPSLIATLLEGTGAPEPMFRPWR